MLWVALAMHLLSGGAEGIEVDCARALTLREAVESALRLRRDIQISRVDSAIAELDIRVAEAAFFPRLLAETQLAADRLPGSAQRFGSSDHRAGASLEIGGRLPWGTKYSLGWLSNFENYRSPEKVYGRNYQNTLRLSLTQPILRGAWSAGWQPISIAVAEHDVDLSLLEARVQSVLAEVDAAYWSLVLALDEERIQEHAVRVAEEQVKEAEARHRLGTVSDVDLVEARAALSRKRQEKVDGKAPIAAAEDALVTAMGIRFGEEGWSSAICLRPDGSKIIHEVSGTFEEHLSRALENRPEVQAAKKSVAVEEAKLELAASERLPSLEAFAAGSLIGFAGTLDPEAAAALADVDAALQPDPRLIGDAGRALSNLGTKNFVASVGLRLELPVAGGQEAAREEVQRLVVERERLAALEVIERVGREVRAALSQLRIDSDRVQAAEETEALYAELLEGARKSYQNGRSTTYDVLRAADALARAESDAARARTAQRLAQTRVALAEGTLLEDAGIEVRTEP